MKMIYLIITTIVFFTTNLNAAEDINILLKSEYWRDRDKALGVILENIEEYENSPSFKPTILKLLIDEQNRYKDLIKNNYTPPPEEGEGEYYISLAALVINYNFVDSIEILLDSIDLGGTVPDAVVNILIQEDEENMKSFDVIKKRYMSDDIFYKGKRGSFLIVMNKYLNQKTKVPVKKKRIIKEMVLKGLEDPTYGGKKYAIQCSKFLKGDTKIREKLREIAYPLKIDDGISGQKSQAIQNEALDALDVLEQK